MTPICKEFSVNSQNTCWSVVGYVMFNVNIYMCVYVHALKMLLPK